MGKFQKSTKARRALETYYEPSKTKHDYVSKRERAEVSMFKTVVRQSSYSTPDHVRGNARAHVAFTRLSSKPKA